MLLGLDLGTASLKALLLSLSGEVIAEASAAYEVTSSQPGWAETDPQRWWQATTQAVRAVLRAADAVGRAPEVQAIGLSGQMHGVVLVDAVGEPLRPAMLWADTRAAALLRGYADALGSDLARVGNPVTAGMAGPLLAWLQAHEPQLLARARWALQPKDWLRLRLTGEVAAEPSDASGTLLFAVSEGVWVAGVMERLGLEPTLLPPLLASAAVAGTLRADAAEALGLTPGVRVVAGGADTACAALGSGLLIAGEAQLSVGTGAQITLVQAAPSAHPEAGVHLFRTVLEAPYARFYALAAVQNAGLALEWARRSLALSWEDLYALAFNTPPGSEGATFLPYLSGERTPHLDAQVRGAWAGLSLHHTPGHLARSALEGVAFSLRTALEALTQRAPLGKLKLAGGGSAHPLWQQLLADSLQTPLYPTETRSASARGAALLAGLGAGVFSSAEALPHGLTGVATGLSAASVTAPVLPVPNDALEAAYGRFKVLYPLLRGWPPAS